MGTILNLGMMLFQRTGAMTKKAHLTSHKITIFNRRDLERTHAARTYWVGRNSGREIAKHFVYYSFGIEIVQNFLYRTQNLITRYAHFI